jgi:F-type H+-transporting ATPase subunit epsilon
MAILHLIIVTPEATVRDEQVEFVTVPLFDGELGIAPKHSPFIGRLGYGELRFRQEGKTERYYVDGGFVQMVGDTVSVLTNRAVPAVNLNPNTAREQLAAARARKVTTPEAMALRDKAETQARAIIRVAEHAGKK